MAPTAESIKNHSSTSMRNLQNQGLSPELFKEGRPQMLVPTWAKVPMWVWWEGMLRVSWRGGWPREYDIAHMKRGVARMALFSIPASAPGICRALAVIGNLALLPPPELSGCGGEPRPWGLRSSETPLHPELTVAADYWSGFSCLDCWRQ